MEVFLTISKFYNNNVISETKDFFWNLLHLQKYPCLIISEIIDAERRGYLNV